MFGTRRCRLAACTSSVLQSGVVDRYNCQIYHCIYSITAPTIFGSRKIENDGNEVIIDPVPWIVSHEAGAAMKEYSVEDI